MVVLCLLPCHLSFYQINMYNKYISKRYIFEYVKKSGKKIKTVQPGIALHNSFLHI